MSKKQVIKYNIVHVHVFSLRLSSITHVHTVNVNKIHLTFSITGTYVFTP